MNKKPKSFLGYDEFINESDNTAKVVEFFTSLARNYNSTNNFYNTDASHFVIDIEKREWKDLRQTVKLEKTSTIECNYVLEFQLDNKDYKLHIKFEISLYGQNEKDAPEPGNDSSERLSAVLDKIDVLQFKIDSQYLNYETDNPNSQIKRVVEDFLVKVLADDYDSLSSKIYSIQQK